jgi:hypothetical protein
MEPFAVCMVSDQCLLPVRHHVIKSTVLEGHHVVTLRMWLHFGNIASLEANDRLTGQN